MNTAGKTRYGIQGIFVFGLLGLFAVMSTVLVLLGAQFYRATVQKSEENQDSLVLGSYVRSMVRAQDAEGAVGVEEEDGIPVLSFREQIGGDTYVTRLYVYGGSLRELFAGEDMHFSPEAGTEICPAEHFIPSLEGDMLRVKIRTAEGEEETVEYWLRCGGGAIS